MIGERLRRRVSEPPIPVGAPLLRVTLSVGVAAHPEAAAVTLEDLVRSADEALYAAKAAGRDRVVVARPAEGSTPAARRRAANRTEPAAATVRDEASTGTAVQGAGRSG